MSTANSGRMSTNETMEAAAQPSRLQQASLDSARRCGAASTWLQRALAVRHYRLRLWADNFAPAPEDDQYVGFMDEPPTTWIEGVEGVSSAPGIDARHRGSPGDTPGQWLARLRRSEQKEVADRLHRQASEKRASGDNDGARELYCWVRQRSQPSLARFLRSTAQTVSFVSIILDIVSELI